MDPSREPYGIQYSSILSSPLLGFTVDRDDSTRENDLLLAGRISFARTEESPRTDEARATSVHRHSPCIVYYYSCNVLVARCADGPDIVRITRCLGAAARDSREVSERQSERVRERRGQEEEGARFWTTR